MLKVETLVKRTLRRGHLSKTVAETRFELGEDPWGEKYVYVWVILRDGLPEKAWEQKALRPLREGIQDSIRAALRRVGVDRDVYVAFREKSEQDELDAEVVRR